MSHAARALLQTLRAPIESAYAAALASASAAASHDAVPVPPLGDLGPLGDVARELAATLSRLEPWRKPRDEERGQRRLQLVQSLLRMGAELGVLSTRPILEQQRVLAAGMRVCASIGLEIGTSAPAPPRPAVAAHLQPALVPTPAPTPPQPPAAPKPQPSVPAPPVTPDVAPKAAAPAPAAPAPPTDPLAQPLRGLPGVGPRTAERLEARGLRTVLDALYFLPRRWEDLRAVTPVGELKEGVPQTTLALVERSRVVPARRRFLEVALRGEDGTPLVARWFVFHGGLVKRFAVAGQRVLLTGVPTLFRNTLSMVHPEVADPPGAAPAAPVSASVPAAPPAPDPAPAADAESDGPLGRVRVRYPDIEGVPPRTVEKLCQGVAERFAVEVPDGLPAIVRQRLGLLELPAALRALHLIGEEPDERQLDLLNQGLAPPQRRLIFEELFFLQLGLCRRRAGAHTEASVPCAPPADALARLRAILPFTPTRAQDRAIEEIRRDLARPHPMQRLLHGDVGSGKTLVAYAAAELVMASGHQAAIMAPTEILAEQHARTLGAWARATGRKLALLTATTPKSPRKTVLAQLRAGRFDDVWRVHEQLRQGSDDPSTLLDRESILAMLAAGYLDMVVGTHALLAERVEFADLGLVVIDEQHRFGVAQRAALRKKGRMPHLLVMTATPIPRTLALTLYGDLDVTQLDELPPGRTPPLTKVLTGSAGEARCLLAVSNAVAAGRQVYWVCPLIEESEKVDLADATARHAALCKALPALRVGLCHGRLGTAERDDVMQRFRRGELDVLCATTVIEVGVDVPNASLMIVEGAERFGLAQLHQLRGRVGRGAGPSACLLLSAGGQAAARLDVLARSANGFHIAEADLRIRGPGEVLGVRQAGLPPLRYADLLRDLDLLQLARREAAALLARDPALDAPEHRLTRAILRERWALADGTLE